MTKKNRFSAIPGNSQRARATPFDIIIAYDILDASGPGLTIREYVTPDGRNPFRAWLESLDMGMRARVQARILRFETGNLGDHKRLSGGIWEARLAFGPGYRIYFGRDGSTVVLLLAGGCKDSQTDDIRRAERRWRAYLEDKAHDST